MPSLFFSHYAYSREKATDTWLDYQQWRGLPVSVLSMGQLSTQLLSFLPQVHSDFTPVVQLSCFYVLFPRLLHPPPYLLLERLSNHPPLPLLPQYCSPHKTLPLLLPRFLPMLALAVPVWHRCSPLSLLSLLVLLPVLMVIVILFFCLIMFLLERILIFSFICCSGAHVDA
jgi:hypothetical protein